MIGGDGVKRLYKENILVALSTRARKKFTAHLTRCDNFWLPIHKEPIDGLKGHWSVSRRGPEPGPFFGDPAPLAHDNIYIYILIFFQRPSPAINNDQSLNVLCVTGR